MSNVTPDRVSLFVTCVVDQFYPEVGEATTAILRKLGIDVEFIESQTCCGQPAFNTGYWKEARPLALKFLDEYGEKPYIVMPSGSCASMVKVFYEELFQNDAETLRRVHDIGPKVYELSEFLADVIGVNNLPARNKSGRKVTYHEACHLRRELGAVTQARSIINTVPGMDIVEMEQAEVCCGFGGTFAVKYPEISGAMLQDKIDNIRDSEADTVVACDSTCLMHIAGGLEKQNVPVECVHLAQLLDEAIE